MKPSLLTPWILIAGVTILPGSAAGTDDPTEATALFDRHFAAIGGRDAAAELKSVTISGTIEEAGRPTEFTLLIRTPGLLRFTTRDPQGQTVDVGRDADARMWRQDSRGIGNVAPDQAGQLMHLVLGLNPGGQLSLAERLEDAVCEPDRQADRPLMAIGRQGRTGMFPRLLFDPNSGLLVQIGDTALDDYRLEGRVQLPHRLRRGTNFTCLVRTVVFNDVQPDATFARPGSRSDWLSGRGRGLPGPPMETRLSTGGKLEIVRQPPPASFRRGRLAALPRFDPTAGRHGQVDLRGWDLSRLDLRDRRADLLQADFDAQTLWPDVLPTGFDPKQVEALGRNPGLGVRQLHAQGVTGRGIGIGIIDQPLLIDHREYADRLRLYEEIHSAAGAAAQMHGPAVASIALGKTCGVAPEAELYYVAEQHGEFVPGSGFDWDFDWVARSINRLLSVNRGLPAGRKLRVISISVGWDAGQKGYEKTMAAVRQADREGVFVISTALRATHRLAFDGLDRPALADPDAATSYGPGSWWAKHFWDGQMRFKPGRRLCVPMDGRTTASPTGPDDYVHYGSAGWSWAVPWIAGLYALGCQVDPGLTPERFWSEAMASGRTIRLTHDREEIEFGTIADPVALMARLGKGRTQSDSREPVPSADDQPAP